MASALALGGCATIFSGTSQNVTFTSEPAGASVMINGNVIGTTPLTYELKRSTFKHATVTFRKKGYESERFPLKKTLNSTALINCTSVLSWGTDALTGAMMEYSPDKYFVELTPGARKAGSLEHRWALQFVLVHHRQLTTAIARRDGEALRTLAELFGVPSDEYPAFTALLGAHGPELVRHEHPHELFRALTALLAPFGFRPREPAHLRFENTFELVPGFTHRSLAMAPPR